MDKNNKRQISHVMVIVSLVSIVVIALIGINVSKSLKEYYQLNHGTQNNVTQTDSYKDIESFFINLKDKAKRERTVGGLFKEKGSVIYSAVEDTASAPMNGIGDGPSSSKTELQVEGVDEADIIKNDGKYIYIVHQGDDPSVLIVDTSNPSAIYTIGKIELTEKDGFVPSVREIFIKDNYLILLTDYSSTSSYFSENTPFEVDCIYLGCADDRTGVQIYDISNKMHPSFVTSYAIDGWYTTSRLIGSKLVLISRYCVPLFEDNTKIRDKCIPKYWINDEEHKIAPDKINIIENNEENTYAVMLTVDIDKENAVPQTTAVLGGSDEVYYNSTDLYISRYDYISTRSSFEEYTEIFRFDIASTKFVASTRIKGSVLNQFSMDEYNGYFRIATCLRNDESCITVLDKDLNQVGHLSGIGKDESIYAVRFMGDTAYVVTFFQTDPLFIIDLSNPEEPKIAGELKLPGFSSMLYPWGENQLIGIGEDGDENGSNGNLKISLFDVSNPLEPKEISKAVVNTYAYTPADYDHKAFTRIGNNEFAIPINGDGNAYICTFKVENNKIVSYKKYESLPGDYCYFSRAAYINNTIFALGSNRFIAYNKNSCNVLSFIDMPTETYSRYYRDIESYIGPDTIIID